MMEALTSAADNPARAAGIKPQQTAGKLMMIIKKDNK